MTGVPQLGVPEIFIDDEDEGPPQSLQGVSALDDGTGWSPLASSADPAGPSSYHRRDPSQSASTRSPSTSPQRSPMSRQHRPGLSVSDTYDNSSEWHSFARPLSPGGTRAADHSRQNSVVSAQDVLEVLDQSAWGESIRRSFTARRRSRSGGGGPS